jgi:hypothetical protein
LRSQFDSWIVFASLKSAEGRAATRVFRSVLEDSNESMDRMLHRDERTFRRWLFWM